MLKIYVDADSITQIHREIIIRRAISEKAELYFVADRSLKDVNDAISLDTKRLRDPYRETMDKDELRKIKSKIQMIIVDNGANSADDEIVRIASSPALAITHDIPLSQRLIEKSVTVIDDRGNVLDSNNINERLSIRDINRELREMGLSSDKSKRIDSATMNKFAAAFDKSINDLKKLI